MSTKKSLRLALQNAVTAADIERIAVALIERAATGDTNAAKLLLERCLGKPAVARPSVTVQAQQALVTSAESPGMQAFRERLRQSIEKKQAEKLCE